MSAACRRETKQAYVMSKFRTSYNAYIITAENIPHEETQFVCHADFVVEDVVISGLLYMYTREIIV